MRVWLWRSEEVRHRIPGAVPGGGPPEGETLSGLPIGLTMVSERRPLRLRGFLLERLTGPSVR